MQYPKSALLLSPKAFFKHGHRDGITELIFFVQFLSVYSTEITLTATVGFFPELPFIVEAVLLLRTVRFFLGSRLAIFASVLVGAIPTQTGMPECIFVSLVFLPCFHYRNIHPPFQIPLSRSILPVGSVLNLTN